jgi:hypothetical protein
MDSDRYRGKRYNNKMYRVPAGAPVSACRRAIFFAISALSQYPQTYTDTRVSAHTNTGTSQKKKKETFSILMEFCVLFFESFQLLLNYMSIRGSGSCFWNSGSCLT